MELGLDCNERGQACDGPLVTRIGIFFFLGLEVSSNFSLCFEEESGNGALLRRLRIAQREALLDQLIGQLSQAFL